MKFIDEFRDQALVQDLARRLAALALTKNPATVMEVCGTHTMAAARFGLKSLLPPGVDAHFRPRLPGVRHRPVRPGRLPGPGDRTGRGPGLLRRHAPGPRHPHLPGRPAGPGGRGAGGLLPPGCGGTGPGQTPEKHLVFFGVGFETTMPATALAIQTAARYGLDNFSVCCVHKTMPAALKALLSSGEVRVSGLLCPGHVTTIIGTAAYDFIPAEFGLPCAVTGFEPVDMLLGIESILRQMKEGKAGVDNVYTRAVSVPANPQARELLAAVFAPDDADWRGLGVIPGSGVRIREPYARFDARARFPQVWERLTPPPPSPCRCGEVLRGVMRPVECPLFAEICTPAQPLGPCMVSTEGACAAAYRYER